MSMRWLAQSLIALSFASCSTVPATTNQPALPIGEFYDHVLEPLSQKLADEEIDHAKAQIATGRTSPGLAAFFASIFAGPTGGAIGHGLASAHNLSIEQQQAALDSRRVPLKYEIFHLLSDRTRTIGADYHVCVDGAERVYTVQEGRFVRLANGPGPCEVTNLRSLSVE